MGINTGLERFIATRLVAIELKYLLDIHHQFFNTDENSKYEQKRGLSNTLALSQFKKYIKDFGMIPYNYADLIIANSESNRKEKIKLLRSIHSFIDILKASGNENDDLLNSFKSRLDETKIQPFLNFEYHLDNLLKQFTTSIIYNLRNNELLQDFDKKSTIEKIEFINLIVSVLNSTEQGIEYLKNTFTNSGELFGDERIHEILDAIDITIVEDNNGVPSYSFSNSDKGKRLQDDALANFPRLNDDPIISFFSLFSFFCKDAIPAAWSSLLYKSITANNESLKTSLKLKAEQIIYVTFKKVLGETAMEQFNTNSNTELITKVQDYKTTLGSLNSNLFDALSIILGAKSGIQIGFSIIDNESINFNDIKQTLDAVNTVQTNIIGSIKNKKTLGRISTGATYGIGFVTLALDAYIAYKEITYASIYGENMVIVGNVIVLSSTAIPLAVGILVKAGILVGGPYVWIGTAIFLGISLIGSVIIARGKRNTYEQFADYCYFGKIGITQNTPTNAPGDVAYNFNHSNTKTALEEQIIRIQTFMSPLNFKYSFLGPAGVLYYEHTKELNGRRVKRFPNAVIKKFDVGPVENNGSYHGFISNNEFNKFKNEGEVSTMSQIRNKWIKMTVEIGQNDNSVKLIEYDIYK